MTERVRYHQIPEDHREPLAQFCAAKRRDGLTCQQISDQLEATFDLVLCKRLVLRLARDGGFVPDKLSNYHEQIVRWNAEGKTDGWVGQKLGFDNTSVATYRRRHGIACTPRKIKRFDRAAGLRKHTADSKRKEAARAAMLGWPQTDREYLARILSAANELGPHFTSRKLGKRYPCLNAAPGRLPRAIKHLLKQELIRRNTRFGYVLLVERELPEDLRARLLAAFPGRASDVSEAVSEAMERSFVGPDAIGHRFRWACHRIKNGYGIRTNTKSIYAGEDGDFNLADHFAQIKF